MKNLQDVIEYEEQTPVFGPLGEFRECALQGVHSIHVTFHTGNNRCSDLTPHVLIVTTDEREWDALAGFTQPATGTDSVLAVPILGVGCIYYGNYGGCTVALMKTLVRGSIRSAVQKVLKTFDSIKLVLAVGIGWGARPARKGDFESGQRLGDIMVSRCVAEYHGGPEGAVSLWACREVMCCFEAQRVNEWPISKATDEWKAVGVTRPPRVLAPGLILSGSTLLKSAKAVEDLLAVKFFEDALGGEMEMFRIVCAANALECKWAMVKAICDFPGLGNNEQSNERAKEMAALSATNFVHWMCCEGAFDPIID